MATALPCRPHRRTGRSLLTLLLAALFLATGTGTAFAADGYKYWNYFHVTDGKYVFAQTGPADFVPKDGTVEAYRYGLSSVADGLKPRTGPTTYSAADICRNAQPKAGRKAVGVLLDYGTTGDAADGETPAKPRAACAVVATDADGQQVLDAVSDLRLDKSVVCGIDGYPVKTCSVTVKNPPAAGTEQTVDFATPAAVSDDDSSSKPAAASDDGGVRWPLVGVAAAVVVLGGGALLLGRRGRNG